MGARPSVLALVSEHRQHLPAVGHLRLERGHVVGFDLTEAVVTLVHVLDGTHPAVCED